MLNAGIGYVYYSYANMGIMGYPYLQDHDPYLENIRGEPRFKDLMERVKSEWEHFEE